MKVAAQKVYNIVSVNLVYIDVSSLLYELIIYVYIMLEKH